MSNSFLIFCEVLGLVIFFLCAIIGLIAMFIVMFINIKPYFKTIFYMIEYLFHRKDFIEWHKKQVEDERQ